MYDVAIDYGTEGWSFQEKSFDTVDEAVRHAVGCSYGSPFRIVRIINWQANEQQ